ncbi:MAG: hypothetical protein ACI83L_000875 [Cryomorphaceae bacterium]|jgi:hypothetical protein
MRFISKISYFWREIKNAKIMKKTGLIILTTIYSVLAIAQTETQPPAAAPAPAPAAPPQTDQGQKVRLGLSFSPVISWFNASGDAGAVESDGTRFNIAFGLNTDFRIAKNNNYFFSTGIFLLNTGGTINHKYFAQDDNSSDYFLTKRSADFRINYVNIPLTVLLRTNEIGYMRYFGRVGFDASFNTSSTFDYRDVDAVSEAVIESVEDDDASDITSLFRFGLRIEGGFEYSIGGTTNLYFSAAYNNGLSNVFSDDYKRAKLDGAGQLLLSDDGTPQTDKVKAATNLFTITAGVYF